MTSSRSIYIQFIIPAVLAFTVLGSGLRVESVALQMTTVGPSPSAFRALASIVTVRADTNEKVVNIIRTNKLSRSTANGEPIQVLEGDVMLNQPGEEDTLYLWADRVTKFESRDEVLLVGRVLIVQKKDSLTADSVRYFSAPKKGHAMGRVQLSDGEVQVFAPTALHYFDEKHTIFDERVRLVDSVSVLTSLDGEYFSEEKRAEFYGEVVLEEDNTYLEADSVTYYRDTEISLGYGNVFIERIGGGDGVAENDSTTRTFLFGDHVYNDNRAGYSRIDGNAMLFQLKRDSSGASVDSLVMHAHFMEALRDDSLQRLIAVDSVNIWRKDFAAVADSAVYDRISIENEPITEENRLFENPIAWFDSYQLTGDTLRATALAGEIDSLYARSNAFAAYEDTATMKINQLKGENLLGLFVEDSLKSLSVGPQAQSIYFKKNKENQVGGMKTSGDRIELRFENNDLKKIGAYTGVENEYYDGSLIPDPFELEGFFWRPDRKPTRVSMLKDLIRLNRIMQRVSPMPVPALNEGPLRISGEE